MTTLFNLNKKSHQIDISDTSTPLYVKVLDALKLQDISYEDNNDIKTEDDEGDIYSIISTNVENFYDNSDGDYEELEESVEKEIEKMYIQSLKSSIFSEKFQEGFLKELENIIKKGLKTKPKTKKIQKFLKEYSEMENISESDRNTFVVIGEIIEKMANSEELWNNFELLCEEIKLNLSKLDTANKEKKEYINLVLEAQQNNLSGTAIEKIIAYMEKDIESLSKRFIQYNKSYETYYSIEDDLKQEGYIGLINGIKKFNPNKSDNVKFYMRLWIKQAMVSYLSTKNDIIKVPAHIKNILINIQKIVSDFMKNNIDFTNKDIADKLGIPESKVEYILKVGKISNVSVFSSIVTDNNEGEESSMDNFNFMEDKGVNVENSLLDKEETIELQDFIANTLSREEQFVLIHRWALFGAERLRLKDLGDKLNKTEERVRQIEERAKHIIAMRYFDKHIGVSFREKWKNVNVKGKTFNEKMKELMSSI